MFKQTALITWKAEAPEAQRTAILQDITAPVAARFSFMGAEVPGGYRSGDIVWHLHFDDADAWAASGADAALDRLEASGLVATLDAAAYPVTRFAVPEPGLANGVYRTLFLSVMDRATPEQAVTLTNELAGMPDYITEIRNWGMNSVTKARGDRPWTHVWEQEFRTIDDINGPYLNHPYHWAFVDRWFDPDTPDWIVDLLLSSSFSTLPNSVMADYGAA